MAEQQQQEQPQAPAGSISLGQIRATQPNELAISFINGDGENMELRGIMAPIESYCVQNFLRRAQVVNVDEALAQALAEKEAKDKKAKAAAERRKKAAAKKRASARSKK